MAIFYTDNINGDDATGDGSWASPYKTISYATSVVAENDTEIRVVGSGWTALPGTITATENSNVFNTTDDLTSYFPEVTGGTGSAIVRIINHADDFPVPTIFRVYSVSATQILSTANYVNWCGRTRSGLTIEKLDVVHYDTLNTNPTSPLGTSGFFEDVSANISSYTGIEITGGWTAENVRNGVTGIASVNYGQAFTVYGIFLNYLAGARGEDCYFSHFLLANVSSFNNQSNLSYAIGSLWFSCWTGTMFGSSNYGLFAKNGQKAYIYNLNSTTLTSYNGAGNAATTPLVIDQDIETGVYKTSNAIMMYYNQISKTRNTDNYKVKSDIINFRYNSSNYSMQSSGYPFYCNTFKLWQTRSSSNNTVLQFSQINTGDNGLSYIGRVEYGPSVPANHYFTMLGTSIQGSDANDYSILGDGTQELENLLYVISNPNNIRRTIDSTELISKLRSTTGEWIKWDYLTFSQKLTQIETVDYVTGTNALRVKLLNSTTFTDKIPVAITPKFTGANRTATFKLKNLGDAAKITHIAYEWYQYDSTNPTIVEQAVSLTSSYADYTMTVNPSVFTNAANGSRLYFFIKAGNGADLLIDSFTLA